MVAQVHHKAASRFDGARHAATHDCSWLDVGRSAIGRLPIGLTHRNFRLLWIGAFTSSIGTWMQKVAQAWLIVTMAGSESAFFLGLDSFLSELPILLFTMIGGVFADRRDRRHMMLTSQITPMLVQAGEIVIIAIPTKAVADAHLQSSSLDHQS